MKKYEKLFYQYYGEPHQNQQELDAFIHWYKRNQNMRNNDGLKNMLIIGLIGLVVWMFVSTGFTLDDMPFLNFPTPEVIIVNPPNSSNTLQIVTATPDRSQPTNVPAANEPEPTLVITRENIKFTPPPDSQEGQPAVPVESTGRIITFVDGSGTPISGLIVEHYIGDDLVKSVTNPRGQVKVETDYVRLYNEEWVYIENLSLITVK
jgi:hypothetical protein